MFAWSIISIVLTVSCRQLISIVSDWDVFLHMSLVITVK